MKTRQQHKKQETHTERTHQMQSKINKQKNNKTHTHTPKQSKKRQNA